MTEEDQQDFRRFFPELEFHAKDLLGVSVCALDREVLWQGKLFWSNTYLCFHAHIFLKVARVIIQWKDVLKLEKRLMGGIIPSV